MPKFSLDSLWPWLLTIAVIYALLVAVLYFSQSRMIYYPNLPSRKISATPEQVGLDFQEVYFTASDGVRLHGWFLPNDNAQSTLLFFHGNAGNISHRLDSLLLFHALNFEVLIFDYRGYGQSAGKPTELGTYLDAEAAWRYLTNNRGIAATNILLFGRSLGGAIAAHLASRHQAMGLALESAFTSVPDMAAELYPLLPARWLASFRYNTKVALNAVTHPVFIAHSPDDEIIPFTHGRRLFDSARQPKQFMQLAGGHNGGFLSVRNEYIKAWSTFIKLCQTTKQEASK